MNARYPNTVADRPPNMVDATPPPRPRLDARVVGGVALILIGLLTLVATFTNAFGSLILLAIGLIFLAWGIAVRQSGLLIPGGIMTGLGVGVFLAETVWPNLSGTSTGGLIVLCLGLGFMLITPVSRTFTAQSHMWALIPGAILATIGVMLLIGGVSAVVLDFVGKAWPVVLIVIGVIWLVQVLRGQPHEPRQPGTEA